MPPMIEVESLRRAYGAHMALDGVSFRVDAGEIVGFLGPNGAGKSTTMKILTGFTSPTGGRARVAGHDVVTASLEVRRAVGYLPESAPIYPEMLVVDYLDFVGRVRGMPAAERASAVDRVLDECDIADRAHQAVGTLSKGYRQRVGLAQALMHQPPILILDEPTSGLDPNQILVIRDLVRRIGRSRTVLLSTHVLQEVEAMCDRVLILSRGQLVADAPAARVRAESAGGAMARVTFVPGTVRLSSEALQAAVAAVPSVTRVSPHPAPPDAPADALSFEVLADTDVRADLFDLAARNGLRLVELARETTTLEQVFRRLTA